MSTLVECVPNFSEGRDKGKVDAIVDAMKVDGVYVLDREMDADHNRCVITLVGEREAIQEAAIRRVEKAAELIDLCVHKGAHPRMGAADVVGSGRCSHVIRPIASRITKLPAQTSNSLILLCV